jgi:hypothetical protein
MRTKGDFHAQHFGENGYGRKPVTLPVSDCGRGKKQMLTKGSHGAILYCSWRNAAQKGGPEP